MVIGAELRHLRERAGVTREDAAYHIRGSESKISRMELGKVSFKKRDVEDLLTYYGVREPADRDPLLGLLEKANEQGWWHQYDEVLPSWFQPFVGLEGSARLIRTYEAQFVPGLMQTENYARAVIHAGDHDADAHVVEERVKLRQTRQSVLHRGRPPKVWAVVEEAALRRPVGGPAVMRAQLEHLLEVTKLPNVTIQVMPLDAGAHAAETGAFTVLRFEEPLLPDIVYTEQLTGCQYVDKQPEVERYMRVMDILAVTAQRPPDSVRTIKRLAEEFAES
jgi:transcriptional regulator with XRE-family HTH domain